MYEDDDPYLAELRERLPRVSRDGRSRGVGSADVPRRQEDLRHVQRRRRPPLHGHVQTRGRRPSGVARGPRFYAPPYWGPSGWLSLDFEARRVDWDEVAELVESSYRQVALKRMLKALDGET